MTLDTSQHVYFKEQTKINNKGLVRRPFQRPIGRKRKLAIKVFFNLRFLPDLFSYHALCYAALVSCRNPHLKRLERNYRDNANNDLSTVLSWSEKSLAVFFFWPKCFELFVHEDCSIQFETQIVLLWSEDLGKKLRAFRYFFEHLDCKVRAIVSLYSMLFIFRNVSYFITRSLAMKNWRIN